ncbi:translation repressor RelE/RelB/StbE [Neokomagataea thailandica NBRC 106555]|uniref:Addiction module toxin RelE n=3 Tax=Neokomagataea TaxID=1223423 RepID=A0A4Y6VCE3_9PROT|nr:type II toxin-antitoxin system RelE/ParE family toxin [Neokomagataea tanensis]QDH26055.1 addiction module toxin RelE [Neokomagataea tanensis]GBR55168.1 translation repressor RelE/RelB/StbE [Neokomagataea thailandica NBRC 106555]
MTKLQTVVELPEFIKRARAIMSDVERTGLINMLAREPAAGIFLGGGLRKIRFSRDGSGKSGGDRTLYVFGGTHMPIFLLTVFAKNEKDNFTKIEQTHPIQVSKTLVARYGEKS